MRSASLSGPAVPRGSVSTENSILTLYCFSYWGRLFGCSLGPLGGCTHGLERLGHDLGAVVDREDDICDTGRSESLDLVLDHGLVGELDERLGQRERLQLALVERSGQGASRGRRASGGVAGAAYERAQTGSKPSDENDGWPSSALSRCPSNWRH
jgi:hypothetical protein